MPRLDTIPYVPAGTTLAEPGTKLFATFTELFASMIGLGNLDDVIVGTQCAFDRGFGVRSVFHDTVGDERYQAAYVQYVARYEIWFRDAHQPFVVYMVDDTWQSADSYIEHRTDLIVVHENHAFPLSQITGRRTARHVRFIPMLLLRMERLGRQEIQRLLRLQQGDTTV